MEKDGKKMGKKKKFVGKKKSTDGNEFKRFG